MSGGQTGGGIVSPGVPVAPTPDAPQSPDDQTGEEHGKHPAKLPDDDDGGNHDSGTTPQPGGPDPGTGGDLPAPPAGDMHGVGTPAPLNAAARAADTAS